MKLVHPAADPEAATPAVTIGGIRHIVAELGDLSEAPAPSSREQITWIAFTAERVAVVIVLWDEASTS